jgi:hypothetical protein
MLQLHTTLDPYNTTEEVELTLMDASFDWTNAQEPISRIPISAEKTFRTKFLPQW